MKICSAYVFFFNREDVWKVLSVYAKHGLLTLVRAGLVGLANTPSRAVLDKVERE